MGSLSRTSNLHGQKRQANDNLESEQRLSKRLNLLNLAQDGIFYIPKHGNASTTTPVTDARDDSMQLDDTKDKVYIHNLAAEISDIESDEETPLFLPDIEKKLSKIPRSVLTGTNPPNINTQMVLYNVPASLSFPKEHDGVRRAILDSRARAREKQTQEQQAAQNELSAEHLRDGIGHGIEGNDIANEEDLDLDENAMDVG
ncbi:MAG: hypothetical protein Q9219_002022 [cf. Caloplaca sp. 3 TL-2023]